MWWCQRKSFVSRVNITLHVECYWVGASPDESDPTEASPNREEAALKTGGNDLAAPLLTLRRWKCCSVSSPNMAAAGVDDDDEGPRRSYVNGFEAFGSLLLRLEWDTPTTDDPDASYPVTFDIFFLPERLTTKRVLWVATDRTILSREFVTCSTVRGGSCSSNGPPSTQSPLSLSSQFS